MQYGCKQVSLDQREQFLLLFLLCCYIRISLVQIQHTEKPSFRKSYGGLYLWITHVDKFICGLLSLKNCCPKVEPPEYLKVRRGGKGAVSNFVLFFYMLRLQPYKHQDL